MAGSDPGTAAWQGEPASEAVSFPASTGTRRSGLFTFVGPDGQEARYYGISFTADG